jgi:selT/selW/selH-like putative selenoprotein
VSKQIYKIKPSAVIKGNEGTPRSGSFEVTINDKLIYSKFKSGIFPTLVDIKNWF